MVLFRTPYALLVFFVLYLFRVILSVLVGNGLGESNNIRFRIKLRMIYAQF